MNFYVGNINDVYINANDHLYVIIDNNCNVTPNRKNIVLPYKCIFASDTDDEVHYYNNVAKNMRGAGYDGFMDWVTKCINSFSVDIYHDDNDKPIIYNSIIFLTNNDMIKTYIRNIFNNFGFNIDNYNIKLKNYLF